MGVEAGREREREGEEREERKGTLIRGLTGGRGLEEGEGGSSLSPFFPPKFAIKEGGEKRAKRGEDRGEERGEDRGEDRGGDRGGERERGEHGGGGERERGEHGEWGELGGEFVLEGDWLRWSRKGWEGETGSSFLGSLRRRRD